MLIRIVIIIIFSGNLKNLSSLNHIIVVHIITIATAAAITKVNITIETIMAMVTTVPQLILTDIKVCFILIKIKSGSIL